MTHSCLYQLWPSEHLDYHVVLVVVVLGLNSGLCNLLACCLISTTTGELHQEFVHCLSSQGFDCGQRGHLGKARNVCKIWAAMPWLSFRLDEFGTVLGSLDPHQGLAPQPADNVGRACQ